MTQNEKINRSIINAIIGVLLMVVIGYFIALLLQPKNKDIVLSEEEKKQLDYLTQAIVYDGYDYYPKIDLRDIRFSDMSDSGKTAITAKYLYLMNNGRINPDSETIILDDKTIDIINDQTKKTFDNIFSKYNNFSIILDDYGCGSETFSSEFGLEGSEMCLSKAGAMEIKDMYYQDNYYVVEVYIAFGEEVVKREGTITCKDDEDKVMSYFSVYDKVSFRRALAVKEYDKCCPIGMGCIMEGVAPKRSFMIETAKKENLLYKIFFKKKGNNFIPSHID